VLQSAHCAVSLRIIKPKTFVVVVRQAFWMTDCVLSGSGHPGGSSPLLARTGFLAMGQGITERPAEKAGMILRTSLGLNTKNY